jgi:hypothetical protein
MFENNKQLEIILNDIDADIFEKFIIYAYEGKSISMNLFIEIQNRSS